MKKICQGRHRGNVKPSSVPLFLLQKSVEKDAKAKAEKSTGFKRSQGLERKLTGLDGARAGMVARWL